MKTNHKLTPETNAFLESLAQERTSTALLLIRGLCTKASKPQVKILGQTVTIGTKKHAIITREEADKRQRESKHHTIVQDGEYAAHYVHDLATGVTTLIRVAEISLPKIK